MFVRTLVSLRDRKKNYLKLREENIQWICWCNVILCWFCFQQCTDVPDGRVEWVAKKAYSERLNQRGRNTEQRGEHGVETSDSSDLHLRDDRPEVY